MARYRVYFKSDYFKRELTDGTVLPFLDYVDLTDAGAAAEDKDAILLLDLRKPENAWAGDGVPDAYC